MSEKVTLREAMRIVIEENNKNCKFINGFETPAKYVFLIGPKDYKSGVLMDAYRSVDKATGKYGVYVPHLNIKEYKQCSENNKINFSRL